MDWQERTRLLLGDARMERLSGATVTVVGIGGVGAYAAEMLVRAGLGNIRLIDSDCVSESNINRQLLALRSTVGLPKTEVLSSRLRDINPGLGIEVVETFLDEGNAASLVPVLEGKTHYVVDAIDTLSPKIALIQHCLANKGRLRLVSSMGCGAKLDITKIRICDISKTRECPLAFMIRKRLHKLGIYSGFRAVYSEEKPVEGSMVIEETRNKKSQVGSISYLPAAFGCACAQEVIRQILAD